MSRRPGCGPPDSGCPGSRVLAALFRQGTHGGRGDIEGGDMPTDTPLRHGAPDLPEEFFLDGPVPDGEELLRRTVATVRRTSARSARIRLSLLVAATLVACAAFVGTGVAVGRLVGQPHVSIDENYYSTTDLSTGARLSATVTPDGAGTHLSLTVTGLPPGTPCRLTVIGRDGTRVANGSWRIPPDASGKPMDTNVWMAPDQMGEIDVATGAGPELVIRTR